MKLEFVWQIFEIKNTQVSYIMKIRPVGADRWTDRHDEANSRSSQVCERA